MADTVKITHDKNINVRRKPTTESIIIGTAAAGEEYEYIGTEENGWIHLRLPDGMDGFVSGKMASVISDKDAVAISNEFGSEERIINEEAEESLNDRFVLYRDVPSMPEPNIDKEINFKRITCHLK